MIEQSIVRAGTAAEWADADASDGEAAPTLAAGEVGIVTDTGAIVVGDGAKTVAQLATGVGQVRRGKTTLVAGTKAVLDASVTANSVIVATAQVLGTVTAAKAIAVTARVAGTSFTLTSSDNTDTSVVGYLIIEP